MNNVLLKKISKAVVEEMQALQEAPINTISHKLGRKLAGVDDPKQRLIYVYILQIKYTNYLYEF